VVVVVYNMAREAPRTLHSLSAAYQRHINPEDYEVIVVDNGSNPPFDPKIVEKLSGNFRLVRIDPAPPSPAHALNRGIAEAQGDVIGVMIDGARIATPGLLHFAWHGARLYDRAVVATIGFHLGFDLQNWAIRAGYNSVREDALLGSIDWPNDGYRLFEIGTLAGSSQGGWLQPIVESNALFMRRELWQMLGGFDERFDEPGGGLVNLDVFRRVVEMPSAQLIMLLGEGTFHQLHGGVAANAPVEQLPENLRRWALQYQAIRGAPYEFPRYQNPTTYLGDLPRPALARFLQTAVNPYPREQVEPPLGANFDNEIWSAAPPVPASDPSIAALIGLLHREFRAGHYAAAAGVGRLIRQRAPDEPEPQRVLALVAAWLPADDPPRSQSADYYLAIAEANRILGETEVAAVNYRTALTFNPDLPAAHVALAGLRMPGPDYLVWLERLYGSLALETVIEIGVARASSLALLRPPTVAIGVDPNPTVLSPLKTETHIFAETSDEFFAKRRAENLLAGRPLSLGFIDGLHLFEQALRDFINLESYCGPRSVILIHDTVPLDEPTQRRARETQYHTGDVWKTVLCLKQYRPDLDIFTIATTWSGLTVVTGMDPTSRILSDSYEEAVTRFIETPYSGTNNALEAALNVVPNDWDFVAALLKARGIF
jgi:hypothetical protein